MKKILYVFHISWIVVFLPSLVMGHTTRLATSPLMVKSQVSASHGSINPLTGEARASFDYSMLDSTITFKSPSDYKYSDMTVKGTAMQLGYDGKTSFGHFSGGYYSSKRDYDYQIKPYSSCGGQNTVYDLKTTSKYNTISGIISGQINEKTAIAGLIAMVTAKQDKSRTDTAPTGCFWTSTGTSTRSYSGSASSDYNQIALFGKSEITNELKLGFLLTPAAGGKTNYNGDYTDTIFRRGNGMTLGVGIGKEDSQMAFEGGIIIEQENKNSGDGSSRDLFVLYETLFGGGAFLVGYKNLESDKLEDGSTKIARPITSTTIDLEAQINVTNGIYASGSLSSLNATYGDYGDATADEIKSESYKGTEISFAINALF